MKKIFAVLTTFILCNSVFASDSWEERVISPEETGYQSGFTRILILAQRGIGFAQSRLHNGVVLGNEILLQVDNESFIKIVMKNVSDEIFLISDTPAFVEKIANASKVTIKYRGCKFYLDPVCQFGTKGMPQEVTWTFDESLSVRFKDYKEKIR